MLQINRLIRIQEKSGEINGKFLEVALTRDYRDQRRQCKTKISFRKKLRKNGLPRNRVSVELYVRRKITRFLQDFGLPLDGSSEQGQDVDSVIT